MVRLARGGDPLQLQKDWRTAPDPIACCELLLTKLSMSQLNALHTYMGGTQNGHTPRPGGGEDLSARNHACTLEEFCEAYHRTLNSVALAKYRETIEERLAVIFKKYDVNGDRTLTFDELSILKDMLHDEDNDEEGRANNEGGSTSTSAKSSGSASNAMRQDEVTIYNEIAVPVEWDLPSPIIHEEIEWSDCSRVKYHIGIRKYSVCWKNGVILFDIGGEDQNKARVQHWINGHSAPVVTCLYVPHVKRFFTCSTDRTVVCWNEVEGWARGETAQVSCAQVSIVYDPSSQYVFTGGTDGCIYLFPTLPKFGQPTMKIDAHSDWVNDLLIMPELECVVSCSADATVKFFSTASLELRTTKSSSAYTSGMNFVSYCRKDRTVYTAISGREVLIWSPFLPKPTDFLRGHEKPIVGLKCFDRRSEVVTVDLSGKICIWDTRTTRVAQVLGAPDSASPIGTVHGFAYNTHEHSIAALGDRSLSLFIRQKGSASALLDSVVGHIIYDGVHKVIVCSSGSRVVVFEITTGECRHTHNFGGVEISALASAVQQQLIVGTEEGRVFVVNIGSWKQSAFIQMKDSIRLVVDLGKKSRLSATGECPKALAVSARGVISVFAYGPIAEVAGGPPLHIYTEFVSVELAAYSAKHGLMILTRKQFFEIWDVVYQSKKTSQVLPNWITAVGFVDDIDASLFGTSDGTIHCFHSVSGIASFLIRTAPTPRCRVPPSSGGSGSWWGAQSHFDFIPIRFAFDRTTWSLTVISAHELKMYSLDSIIRRIGLYHYHSSFVLGSTLKYLQQRRYAVDASPIDVAPCPSFACRSKFHAHLLLTVLMTYPAPHDVDETAHMTRLQRLFDMKQSIAAKLCKAQQTTSSENNANNTTMAMGPSPSSAQGLSGRPEWSQLFTVPVDYVKPTTSEKLALDRGDAVYLVCAHMPSFRRACPFKHFPHLAMHHEVTPLTEPSTINDGGAGGGGASSPPKEVPALRRASTHSPLRRGSTANGPHGLTRQKSSARLAALPSHPRDGRVKDNDASKLMQAAAATINDTTSLTIVELKWMIACLAMALQELHTQGFVALFHPEMVRYVAPFYTIFPVGGLWMVGEDASGVLEPHLRPPEGLMQVGTAADIWMLGLTLHKTISGKDLCADEGGKSGSSNRQHAFSIFDLVVSIVRDVESQILEPFRDPSLIALMKAMLHIQPSKRPTAGDIVSLLEGYQQPPRHLICMPLEANEARHEVFMMEEKEAALKCSILPLLEDGEYCCLTMCEMPPLMIVVEYDGQSAHAFLWNDQPKLVGVAPPNAGVSAVYNVSREEVSSVRNAKILGADPTVIEDPSTGTRKVYKVEKYCPFYSEHKALDAKLGKVEEPLPLPYYLEGWHRLKHLNVEKHHVSQKQRDAAVKARWAEALATANETSFEKTLVTATLPLVPTVDGDDDTSPDLLHQQMQQRQLSGGGLNGTNVSSAGGKGSFAFRPLTDTELDPFLFGKQLNPHWGKSLSSSHKKNASLQQTSGPTRRAASANGKR